MTPENLALRRAMKRLNISQEELARRIREDGRDTAGCNRAMVYRWLRGTTRRPQPRYLRALERVTGLPAASLGYAGPCRPGHDLPLDDEMSFQDSISARIQQLSLEIAAWRSSVSANTATISDELDQIQNELLRRGL